MGVTSLRWLLAAVFFVAFAYELGISPVSGGLQICLSITPDSNCRLNCSTANDDCSQACSKTNCTMYCSPETKTCKQICGRPDCASSVCYAREKCNQICQNAVCPTMECFSPTRCDFEVTQPGGPSNTFVCRHNETECNLDCFNNANCKMESYSSKGSITCQNSNCTIDFRHESAASTVSCVSGATCNYKVHESANVSCNGQCVKTYHPRVTTPTPVPPTTTPSPTPTDSSSTMTQSFYLLIMAAASINLLCI